METTTLSAQIEGTSYVANLFTAKDPSTYLEGFCITDPENLIATGRKWRRQKTTSPFVHGDTEVNAVMDVDSVSITVLVLSQTAVGLQSHITLLVNAISQPEFVFSIYMNELVGWSWLCREADFSISMNRKFMHALAPEFKITFDRQPVPLTGPY